MQQHNITNQGTPTFYRVISDVCYRNNFVFNTLQMFYIDIYIFIKAHSVVKATAHKVILKEHCK